MRVPSRDPDKVERRVTDLEFLVRRSVGLHGLYAAAGLVIGLFLPVARLAANDAIPDTYTAFGLVFSVHADYQLDAPAQAVIAGLLIAVPTMVAIVAFLVAARSQSRRRNSRAGHLLCSDTRCVPGPHRACVHHERERIRGRHVPGLAVWELGPAVRRLRLRVDRHFPTRPVRSLTSAGSPSSPGRTLCA